MVRPPWRLARETLRRGSAGREAHLHRRAAGQVVRLRGVRAIAISQPHFDGSMIEWTHAFDAPVYSPPTTGGGSRGSTTWWCSWVATPAGSMMDSRGHLGLHFDADAVRRSADGASASPSMAADPPLAARRRPQRSSCPSRDQDPCTRSAILVRWANVRELVFEPQEVNNVRDSELGAFEAFR